MSKTEHTPGPWILTEYDGHGPMEIQSSENPGASLALVYAMNPEEIEPNARLIASAPALLAEVERLKEEDRVREEKLKEMFRLTRLNPKVVDWTNKIQEQEFIIHGLEEGSAQWEQRARDAESLSSQLYDALKECVIVGEVDWVKSSPTLKKSRVAIQKYEQSKKQQ